MRQNIFIIFLCTLPAFCFAQPCFAQYCSIKPAFTQSSSVHECYVKGLKLGGYVGDRVGTCIEERVKKENVAELIDIFRYRNETKEWQSEFFGKWMLGAIDSYKYTKDPELLELIRTSIEEFLTTQSDDGYIGNYSPDAQFAQWDIWGRKYSALALLAYYKLTGDDKALNAVKHLISHLIRQLHERNVNIASTGNFLGMASCSILEPVVYLYEITREEQFLDFAIEIVTAIDGEGSAKLLTKAVEGVPVSKRSLVKDKGWWKYADGQKAYEMMSCYVGMMELGRVLGDPFYREVVERVAENIRMEEINVAGSGTSSECWYDGKALQTLSAYNTMETCVTFTYMQLCSRLFLQTGNSLHIEEFERSMYNALFASLRSDGSMMSEYCSLEGRRFFGKAQCGMHTNCCEENGPRGFALIPQMALTTQDNTVFVNLYMPMSAEIAMGKKGEVSLKMDTDFPAGGDVTIEVHSDGHKTFTLALRIPQYVTAVGASVNGEEVEVGHTGGYLFLNREWKNDDCVRLRMKLETQVLTQNNFLAIVRGPVVFARDSRFGDGDVDECLVIKRNEGDTIDVRLAENVGFAWLTMSVPAVLGPDRQNAEKREIHFCDFSSAGNDWSHEGRYRVWIPQTMYVTD